MITFYFHTLIAYHKVSVFTIAFLKKVKNFVWKFIIIEHRKEQLPKICEKSRKQLVNANSKWYTRRVNLKLKVGNFYE